MKNTLKIAELASILYALLFFLGYCTNWVYFSAFGVEVNEYFTIAEILLLFLSKVMVSIYFIPLFVVSAVMLLLLVGFIELVETEKNWISKTICLVVMTALFGWLISGINLSTIRGELDHVVNGKIWKHLWEHLSLLVIPMVAFVFLFIYYQMFLKKDEGKNEESTSKISYYLIGTIVYILVIFTAMGVNKADAYSMKTNCKGKAEVTFLYNGEPEASSKSLIYVGGSANYLFMYECTTGYTLIFERSKIEKLQVLPNGQFSILK